MVFVIVLFITFAFMFSDTVVLITLLQFRSITIGYCIQFIRFAHCHIRTLCVKLLYYFSYTSWLRSPRNTHDRMRDLGVSRCLTSSWSSEQLVRSCVFPSETFECKQKKEKIGTCLCLKNVQMIPSQLNEI